MEIPGYVKARYRIPGKLSKVLPVSGLASVHKMKQPEGHFPQASKIRAKRENVFYVPASGTLTSSIQPR